MERKGILQKYRNGNVEVTIYEDGTRICENNLDYFNFDFPLSIDCKITNKCFMNCPMCHEKSTPDGKHGDIMNAEFIETLSAGTEIAIGGGAVTGHPDFVAFLKKLKSKNIIANVTINQKEYEKNQELIDNLLKNKLINGLGVSFNSFNDDLWDKILSYPNVVVHLIAGIYGGDVFNYFIERNAKILILGYKDFGRGHDFKENAQSVLKIQLKWLQNNVIDLLNNSNIIAFDNLALEQLEMKNKLSDKQWKYFYQGDDGVATMYIDLVEKQFAKNSTSTIRYPLLSNIKDMFKIIKETK